VELSRGWFLENVFESILAICTSPQVAHDRSLKQVLKTPLAWKEHRRKLSPKANSRHRTYRQAFSQNNFYQYIPDDFQPMYGK